MFPSDSISSGYTLEAARTGVSRSSGRIVTTVGFQRAILIGTGLPPFVAHAAW